MKFASIIPASLPALLFLGGFASPSVGQESRWGSPGEETVKFIGVCRGLIFTFHISVYARCQHLAKSAM